METLYPSRLSVACVAFLFLAGFLRASGQEVSTDEQLSEDYEVWVNGAKAAVHAARVQDPPWEKSKTQLDFGGNYSFVSFGIRGSVEVKIRSSAKDLSHTVVRPGSSALRHLVKGFHEISFTIDKPRQLSIEPDGKQGPLFLFADPVNAFHLRQGDKNVIYFGPGIHRPASGKVEVKDHQTLYLAEGAILKAGVVVSGSHATVCGRGIIDGNDFVWGQHAPNMLTITGDHVTVKDIIIRGAASWTVPVRNCRHIVIDNIKILGGRAQNDDGIDIVNAQDVLVRNCFIRTDDDCIALKGMQKPPADKNVEGITVENSILWCDRARVFLLGHESRAPYMRDIQFRHISIIHFSMVPFLLEPGENMRLENVLFRDISLYGEGQPELIRLRPTINQYMLTKVPGFIRRVTFRNISVTGAAGAYSIQLSGADKQHNISGVVMSGITLPNGPLTKESKNLQVGQFVDQFSIR